METQLTNTVWIVNVLTGAGGLTVFWFLLKGLIKRYDDRLLGAEKEADEIKRNYNRKFEEVHEKIDTVKEEIIERIDSINQDKMLWRMQQTKDVAILQTDLKNLTEAIKQNYNGRNSRGREDRDGNR